MTIALADSVAETRCVAVETADNCCKISRDLLGQSGLAACWTCFGEVAKDGRDLSAGRKYENDENLSKDFDGGWRRECGSDD